VTRPLSLRWRLTAVIGALALAAGGALAALAYVLVANALDPGQVPDVVEVRDPFGGVRRFPVTTQVGRDVLDAIAAQVQAEALATLLRQSLLALLVVGVLAGVSAWLAAGRVLRPLQQMTATARRLSTENLDERIALQGPQDELKELADTFDAMLARLDAAFASQRRFVADASHELRTPLAVMRTEVDVTLADPDATPDELRRMGEVVRTATERADRLVDSLLLLARSDAAGGSGSSGAALAVREPVRLDEVVAVAVAAVAPEADARGLTLTTSYGGGVVTGDRGLLERLAGNLVENAVRHNTDGGWVAVRTLVEPARPGAAVAACLDVANSGAGVDAADVDALFEPFRRAGAARTATRGAGLGLSIVRAVARAHGGEVTAQAIPEGGLDVRVALPTGG
jgi:signal transduction histidine kinase